MINKSFEAYKLKREIKRSGINYEFKRVKQDDFGEPTGEYSDTILLSGIYHETNSVIKITTGDTTRTRTKKIPMILCSYEDTASLLIGDILVINGKVKRVTGVVNIQEWNIIGDISMEESDYVI